MKLVHAHKCVCRGKRKQEKVKLYQYYIFLCAVFMSAVCMLVCFLNVCYPPVPCETLQSTTDIIVNLTSTAMGSNATYQCRDGSSNVYTTQCTSNGVWEPNPNSTLDCTTPGVYGVL